MADRLYVRRGGPFSGTLTVYVDNAADATTNAGTDFVGELRSQRGALLRTLDATAGAGAGEIDFLDTNGTATWPIGVVVLCMTWVDSTGASRSLFPPIELECVAASEASVVELSTSVYLQRGADSSGQVARFFGAVGGASSGSGIDQLTADVTAGPGTGSQAATVVAIQGQPVSSAAPGTGDVLTWDGAAWEAAAVSAGITELTGDATAGPGTGAQVVTVVALQGRGVQNVGPSDGDVLTWNTGASRWEPTAPGGGAAWQSQIIATAGHGCDPAEAIFQMQRAGNVAATPTNITASIARCCAFRPPADITVDTIRFYGVGATTSVYRMAIYRYSDLARLTTEMAFTTVANAWGTVATGLGLALTGGELYFVAVAVNTTGTTAGPACIGGTVAATTGRIATAPESLPGNLILSATLLDSYRFQFAVTAGALPDPAATLAAQAAWTGGMPVFFLEAA